jgi:hypothetical protein
LVKNAEEEKTKVDESTQHVESEKDSNSQPVKMMDSI